MNGYRAFIFTLCLASMLLPGGIAMADCVNDGNNDATTAVAVGLQETVSDVVCPDDQYDYYKLTVTDGDNISGLIKVSSTVNGTEFKLNGANSGQIFVFSSTDASKDYTQQVATGQLQDDTYYLRVTFYSSYANEHPYTLTVDLEEEEETGPTIPIYPGNLFYALKYSSPWPSERGFSGNTGRTGFDGPAGLSTLVKSYTMGEVISDPVQEKRYRGLRVGPDNKICYMDSSNEYIFQFPLDGVVGQEEFEGGSETPPCFDNTGNFYFIAPGSGDSASELVSYDSTWVTERWRKNMPPSNERGILIAGERVYTFSEYANAHCLQVWARDGKKLYNITFPDKVLSAAEDNANDYFYAQTVDTVYKYDYTGAKLWETQPFPEHESEYGLEPEVRLGPIVCPDGRLWVRDADTPTWVVLESDGTKYKEKEDISSVLPPGLEGPSYYTVAVALDSKGRFYEVTRDSGMALMSTLSCYDDYDQQVWTKSLVDFGITDMVLDAKNRIYICYDYYDPSSQTYSYMWQIRNSTDGSTIHAQVIADIPKDLIRTHGIGAELAIGEDGYLVFLHNGGFIAAYKPFDPGNLKMEVKQAESGMSIKPQRQLEKKEK